MFRVPGPAVDTSWLAQFVDSDGALHSSISVLDASWYLPSAGRDPLAEFEQARIPGAVFFDLDKASDDQSKLPHMMPPPSLFAQRVKEAGVSDGDSVIVYDGKGIFSAPRVAFMFEAFGYTNVAVLDGGLPAWRSADYPVETGPFCPPEPAAHPIPVPETPVPSLLVTLSQLMDNMAQPEDQRRPLFDARSRDRFSGVAPEPRAGCPSGHIRGSVNVPYDTLLTADGRMKDAEELKTMLAPYVGAMGAADGLSKLPIASCGSGVTACVVALAFRLAFPQAGSPSVYDGSWSEWGTTVTAPTLLEFADLLQQLSASLGSSLDAQARQLNALATAAKNLEFTSVYEFFELAYRQDSGLSSILTADNVLLNDTLEVARAVTQPPVSMLDDDPNMVAAKRLGLSRKL